MDAYNGFYKTNPRLAFQVLADLAEILVPSDERYFLSRIGKTQLITVMCSRLCHFLNSLVSI